MNKEDIIRLRKSTTDETLFNYLSKEDVGFKNAVSKIQPNGALEKHHLPTEAINLYYGIEELTRPEVNPVSTQMASSTMEGTSFLGRTIRNIPKSGAAFAGDIFRAVTNPFETLGAVADTVVGGGANTLEVIAGFAGTENPEDLFDLPAEQTASAVGQFFADRYGSPDAIKQTIEEDPVGFLADLSAVISVAGAAARGAGFVARGAGATTRATALTRGGQVAKSVAGAIDPVSTTTRVISKPFRLLSKPVKALNKANVKSAFNLTPSQVQRISKMGKHPAEFLAENRIVGNTVDDVVKALEQTHYQSYDDVNKALARVKGNYKISQIEGLERTLANLDDLFDVPGLEAEQRAVKALAKKKTLSLPEMNEVKRLIDKADFIFKKSGDVSAGAKAQGGAVVRGRLKTFIENEASKQGIENIAEMNNKTQISKGILDEISKSAGKGERFLSLRDAVYGGTAGIVAGPVGGFLTIIGERLAATPAVATRLNLILNSLSKSEYQILQKAIQTGEATADARRIMQSILNSIESAPVQLTLQQQ